VRRISEPERKFYDSGIKKMVHHMQKCIDLNGDYVEKQRKVDIYSVWCIRKRQTQESWCLATHPTTPGW
jgi:hypothetical protein